MGANQSSQNSKKVVPQVQLSNRCIETQQQVLTLLQVMGMTSSALAHTYRFDEDGRMTKLELTEGQVALEKTLWNACERMNSLLQDTARWDNSFQDKVEKEYNELHALQIETMKAQHAAAAEIIKPHFQYRPALMRTVNGGWMAILGDVDHLEFAVYGIGETAQAALEDFDAVFLNGVPPSVLDYCQKRVKALEAGEPVPPFPNTEKTHEPSDDNLDETGNLPGAEPQG